MKRYCLALDLVDNEVLIAEYERYHQKIWPEIYISIKESGIENMEIYRIGNRLFMIMETLDSFSFEYKSKMDAENAKVHSHSGFDLTCRIVSRASAVNAWASRSTR